MDSGPVPLKEVLLNSLERMGLLQKAQRYRVFSSWRQIVGDIALNARPRKIDGDVLYVSTSSSTWAQELTFMKRRILAKINGFLGGKFLSDIHFSEHLWGDVASSEARLRPSSEMPRSHHVPFVRKALPASGEELIRDTHLRAAFRGFASAAHARQDSLLAQGFVRCSVCGGFYDPKADRCPYCKLVSARKDALKVEEILLKSPEFGVETVRVASGVKERDLIAQVRSELDERWSRSARYYLAKGDLPGAKQILSKLVSLRTSRRLEELNKYEVESALGRKLARILLEDLKNEELDHRRK